MPTRRAEALDLELDREYAFHPMTPEKRKQLVADISKMTDAKKAALDLEPDVHVPGPHNDVTGV